MSNPDKEVYDMERDYDVVLELAQENSQEAYEDVFGCVGGEPPSLDDVWPDIKEALDGLEGKVTPDEVVEAVRYGWRRYQQNTIDDAER